MKNKNIINYISAVSLFTILLSSCLTSEYNNFAEHESKNSIYWWKTVYDPNQEEEAFLDRHDIMRMYVRYFDVIYDDIYQPEPIVPNATIKFVQTPLSYMEIIPTVFFTNKSMMKMDHKAAYHYVPLFIERILAINKKYGIENVREIQVDCDWTNGSEDNFFFFCSLLRDALHEYDIALSSTIRMHQLRKDVPPVDRGVLMCYNTGALRNINTENSILTEDDVEAYVKRSNIAKYPLPLDVAYPTFSWNVVYDQGDTYLGLIHDVDLSDTIIFKKELHNTYRVVRQTTSYNTILEEGYKLRHEVSDINSIMNVKKIIDCNRNTKDKSFSNIIYHLDSDNLSNYSDEDIEQLYNTECNEK